jgi:hypothetical protein
MGLLSDGVYGTNITLFLLHYCSYDIKIGIDTLL